MLFITTSHFINPAFSETIAMTEIVELHQLRNGVRKGTRVRPSVSASEALSEVPPTCLTRRLVARNLWSMNLAFLLCSTAVTGMTFSHTPPVDITWVLVVKLVASEYFSHSIMFY